MTLAAGMIIQIQTTATASNVNGGGFNPANANMATDLACDANTGNTNSPIVSSASYNFVAGDVGAKVYVQSGTSWTPGWYPIASVASNKATLSAAVGQASQLNTATNLFGTNTVAGCGTVATPTAGVWSIDYSQSDAAAFALTDLASLTGTTNPSTVTSVLKPFGVNHVGNVIKVTGGTNFLVDWYEIVSMNVVTATLDKAVGSAATLTSGTANIGGALSLGSSDDAVYELASSSATAATRFFIKSGSYTQGGVVTISAAGNINWPIIIEGYVTNRGDRPTGATRPAINIGGGGTFTNGVSITITSVQFIGTSSGMLQGGGNSIISNCKITNTSATAGRTGITPNTNSLYLSCECISYRGTAATSATTSAEFFDCYFHNSVTGYSNTNTGFALQNCIIESCITTAISSTNATTNGLLNNCTLYGSEAKLGIGVTSVTSSSIRMLNTILYGFTTAVSADTASTANYDDYNNYFNNTTDVNSSTNWQKGANDIAVNPNFTSVSQVTGTAGKFSAGNSILIDTTQNFTSLGVVAGRDFLYIISGTGITNSGMWVGITSISTTTNPNDTLNLDTAQGTNTTADKVYTIPIGHNFLPTNAALNVAYPGVFPAGLTTGSQTIGGVQTQSTTINGSSTFSG